MKTANTTRKPMTRLQKANESRSRFEVDYVKIADTPFTFSPLSISRIGVKWAREKQPKLRRARKASRWLNYSLATRLGLARTFTGAPRVPNQWAKVAGNYDFDGARSSLVRQIGDLKPPFWVQVAPISPHGGRHFLANYQATFHSFSP